jgi:hypothetical protein
LFGFQNIKQERINLDMAPAKHLALSIQQEWMQVATIYDSVYTGSASAKVTPAGGRVQELRHRQGNRCIGPVCLPAQQHDAEFRRGSLFAGNADAESLLRRPAGKKYGSPLTLAYFGLTYKFKVERKP